MIYGYIRVSTDSQDARNQKFILLEYANENKLGDIVILEEVISGKTSWTKREILKTINKIKKGDILLVSEVSRLGRSTLELFEIISIIVRAGGVVHSVNDNYTFKDNINSNMYLFGLSFASQLERELISQRTKSALKRKKAEGVKLGRPKGSRSSKLDDKIDTIKKYLDLKVSVTSIAKIICVPQPTLYYFCKTRNLIN